MLMYISTFCFDFLIGFRYSKKVVPRVGELARFDVSEEACSKFGHLKGGVLDSPLGQRLQVRKKRVYLSSVFARAAHALKFACCGAY